MTQQKLMKPTINITDDDNMYTDTMDNDKYKTNMFPPYATGPPATNTHSDFFKSPIEINNPDHAYNVNTKGVGEGLWPYEPVQYCTPNPVCLCYFNLM